MCKHKPGNVEGRALVTLFKLDGERRELYGLRIKEPVESSLMKSQLDLLKLRLSRTSLPLYEAPSNDHTLVA